MHTNSREFTLKPDMKIALPCTGIAFRPESDKFKTRNVFAASCMTEDHHLFKDILLPVVNTFFYHLKQ